MNISQQSLPLEEHAARPQNPPIPFVIPPHAPFALQFAQARIAEPHFDGDPKPTATDAHTTGGDGSSPDPGSNEELDWENDD